MGQRGGPIGSSSAASTVPGWRADEFTQFLTDFLEQGVVQGVGGELAVSERAAGANMSVDVAIGRALIEVTPTLLAVNKTHKTWFYNDAIENVSVPTADGTYERIDRIVAKFDMTVDPDGTAGNIVSIELVEGTPAASPSAPATPSNAISLATISVPASDTTISNAQITDTRTFVDLISTVLTEAARVSDLASTATGKGASTIGVEDSGGNFSGADVEAVLAELQGNIDTASALKPFFGDGSDGAKTVASSEDLDPTSEYEYTTLTVNASQTVGLTSANTPLIVKCTGSVTINGTIDLDGDGGSGGAGGSAIASSSGAGEGNAGSSGTDGANLLGNTVGGVGKGVGASKGSSGTNGSGGGGGASFITAGSTGSGANAGAGGSPSTSMIYAMLSNFLRSCACGAGGGGGASGVSSGAGQAIGYGGAGGGGGGAMMMFVGGDLTLGASSVITADGASGSNGENTANWDGGGGGGGGGGTVIILVYGSITDNGVSLSANGGGAGLGGGSGQNGGAGASGKIIIYSITDGTVIES